MKLPEIFKNKIDDIKCNRSIFRGTLDKEESINDVLRDLPVKVVITTKRLKEQVVTIVGKTKNYIVTQNRDVIYINDIIEIHKI